MPNQSGAPVPAWTPPKFGPVPLPETTGTGLKRYNPRYALIGGFRPLELDLYVPQGEGPFPVAIWVHGGGYTIGHRRDFTPWLEAAGMIQKTLDAGMAFASVDYRLGLETSFPSAIHDLNSALRWLAAHASKLNVDAGRFGLWGESAGGHLAAITALTQGQEWFAGSNGVAPGVDYTIKALVDWYGAADLNTIVRPMDGTNEALPDLMRYPPEYFNLGPANWKNPDAKAQASPVNHVSAAMPPTLLIHGDADGMVPYSQSVEFYEAAVHAGGHCELITVSGADHAWFGLAQPRVTEVVEQSVEFLRTRL